MLGWRKRTKEKNDNSTGWTVFVLVVFDLGMLVAGFMTGFFKVLTRTQAADPANFGVVTYEVNNTNLMIIIAISLINILAIYHLVSKSIFYRHLSTIDKTGHVSEGLSKIEAHLINYDKETIAFSHLSAIEHEVGLARKDTHNVIWVITNDFEENNDTDEGRELREAILDNLATNVDYYYIVSKRYEEQLQALGKKLSQGKGRRTLNGKFNYYVNDAFDFIPTPYYDIILYIKDDPGSSHFIESSSQFFYCFSRNKKAGECFYQKVEEADVWERLTKFVKEYEAAHSKEQKTLVL